MRVVSADEADGDVSRTLILRLDWRSAEATRFLRDLDRVHIANKYRVTGRPGPGRWPTERVPSSKRVDETSRAPVGLPVNFYDEEWLRDIGADARRELRAQPPMELAFSESTKQYVSCLSSPRTHCSPGFTASWGSMTLRVGDRVPASDLRRRETCMSRS